jgi:serine/threonine protein kinase
MDSGDAAASAPGSAPAAGPAAAGDGVRLAAGTRVLQYELIRELGRGGMGQVFLARDVKLGRKVAIKFLSSLSQKLTERFLVEARATAQLSHEHIVVIHEVNEWQGLPFMVLEYLEGEPLAALVSGGRRLSPARAAELMVPVVRALVRAHAAEIIHRDLKPENIFVTRSGTVKVLDFGIAKVFGSADPAGAGAGPGLPPDLPAGPAARLTREGGLVGTLPYMSPEQWGVDTVDARTDLWAVGLLLFEMVAGRHPLDGMSAAQLAANAAHVDAPMPRVGEAAPDLPGDLERLIDRCLAKRKAQRFESARELLAALELILPGTRSRALTEGESPYLGLTAFQEADAGRFFGRSQDVRRAVARLRETPLMAVVGPSGVGKSSFVRAGVVPALKASGETWEVLITRPGRSPLQALTALAQSLTRAGSGTGPEQERAAEAQEELAARLQREPGTLGVMLRARARQKASSLLLFVDQFEELYTLVSDPAERAAYATCLAGAADDPGTPVRVVVSMRSDFLDRVAGDPRFMELLTAGLLFLQPPDREGLREALVQPIEMVDHRFDSEVMVGEMLDALETTPGALPLLQFTAAKLWDARDRKERLLTQRAYAAMGGVAGALATHADEVLAGLAPPAQRVARAVLTRLVTPEGTRAIVDVADLAAAEVEAAEVRRVVDYLVQARLLVVQTRSEEEGAAVELVHESLIARWPTLRRWLDTDQEDSAFLAQLRSAAKQWDARARAQGLLWRGEAVDEARRFSRRYKAPLPALEREYLAAVLGLADRSARLRRNVVVGVIVVLLGLVAAAAVALVSIRRAEREAQQQTRVARTETKRAQAAEREVKRQFELVQTKEREKQAAQTEATSAKAAVATGQVKLTKAESQLKMSYDQLEAAFKKAQEEKRRAEKATGVARDFADKLQRSVETEKQTSARLARLLADEKARVQELLKQRRKIATELK